MTSNRGKRLPPLGVRHQRVRVFFAWYDLWIGAFYDRPNRLLYICPLPCLVVRIAL